MEEIYANVDFDKSVCSRPSTNKRGFLSSEVRFHGAAVLCLGLLSVILLGGLIGLSLLYHNAGGVAAELSTIKANLTERLQASDNRLSSLTEDRDLLNVRLTEMTKDRDQLNVRLTEMTKERDRLNIRLTEMTKDRDRLNVRLTEMTKDRDRLTRNWNSLKSLFRQQTTCDGGLKIFRNSFYCLSTKTGSWTKGWEDCKTKGADLVAINSDEEQTFISELTSQEAWIGLNDRDREGTWKWADGTPLTVKYWAANQPDNGNHEAKWGEEDCAYTKGNSWNDLSCQRFQKWICEKSIDV